MARQPRWKPLDDIPADHATEEPESIAPRPVTTSADVLADLVLELKLDSERALRLAEMLARKAAQDSDHLEHGRYSRLAGVLSEIRNGLAQCG
jgi:hypothetical protein